MAGGVVMKVDLIAECPVSESKGTLYFQGREYPCFFGKNGLTVSKFEGDGKTPIGKFSLGKCFYRADRIRLPDTSLSFRAITPDDGWCDDQAHPMYNQLVVLPFEGRHEKLYLEEGIYDIVIEVLYNQDPVVLGKGSAIFWHLQSESRAFTEGCLAIERKAFLEILKDLRSDMVIDIRGK